MFKSVDPQPNYPKIEKEIQKYWDTNQIPQKVDDKNKKHEEKVYYDGPITANGMPHYGHVQTWALKDIIPRYWTMLGFHVSRNIGWDCQGLPVEYEIEKEKGFTSKDDIKKFGVAKFNELCRQSVLKFRKTMIEYEQRVGRWIDLNDQYSTMDSSYIESVWWSLKELYLKGLLYKGRKVVAYSTRAGTSLSNAEVTLGGYKDIVDPAVTVKFKLMGSKNAYFLAWTTTPWTLPGNLMLSIGRKISYARVSYQSEEYIIAHEAIERIFGKFSGEYTILEKIKSEDLVDKEYEPLFSFFSKKKKEGAFKVVYADHVTTEEGTGIVHLAPYGAEDFDIFMQLGIKLFDYLDDTAVFTNLVPPYKGMFYKKANKYIIEDLKKSNQLFSSEEYTHKMPMCWRTDTPLIYKPVESWYVNITKIKNDLISANKTVGWIPEHIRDGRFGIWLEQARDWALSRNRYWGTPLPIWVNDKTGKIEVIGSFEELSTISGKKLPSYFDPHKPFVDEITWEGKEGGTYRRIPDVIDVWYDSGSMPFARYHYPFENKKHFDTHFPADYISESIDQTRGWFYTLMVISVALFGKTPFSNAVMGGFMCDENGQKFSKSKKNYPPIDIIFDQFGADVFRYFVFTSPLVRGENASFSERIARETQKEFFTTLWNSYRYFVTYAQIHSFTPSKVVSSHVLDKWIIVRLRQLINDVRHDMDSLEIMRASRYLAPFVTDLSTWYIRRSRERIVEGSEEAMVTLYHIIVEFSKVLAPFVPFISESMYQNLTTDTSVHLMEYPNHTDLHQGDKEIMEYMRIVRAIVSFGNAQRKEKRLSIRQPLSEISVEGYDKLSDEYEKIIKEELNVKSVVWKKSDIQGVLLNTDLTQELKDEGEARNLIRQVQELRKKDGLALSDRIIIISSSWPKQFETLIKEKTIASEIRTGNVLSIEKLTTS